MIPDELRRVEKAPVRHFGPMHGEKTRGHQFVTEGCRGLTIVSFYELASESLYDLDGETAPRLNIEFMRQHLLLSVDLTLEEVAWVRAACGEHLRAFGDV